LLNQTPISSGTVEACVDEGMGCIAFSALAQGMLTSKYLKGIPEGSRATKSQFLKPDAVSKGLVAQLARLNGLAQKRGQTLAQMAISWVLHNKGVTSALIGASKPEQITDCAGALENQNFSPEELAQIQDILSYQQQ
jgi:L-glyceraldehyde 3-phosphate reductase